jgi:RNA recognition motif-containing protein
LTKLYVGNLPYSTTAEDLSSMFANYGNVLSSVIISDKMSGRSKGFGFIELEDDSMAAKAVQELNGSMVGERNIVVSVARPMEERPAMNRRPKRY